KNFGKRFNFLHASLEDKQAIQKAFNDFNPDIVVNLAAQAGVRHSLTNPSDYINSNLIGFSNILESCRDHGVKHLVYASSSSVYGANTKLPFSVHDNVDHPISLYAATKKSNELMAHAYSHLFDLPCTGLRFFTVYGPWGRPDMALFIFSKSILENQPIQVFNHGQMRRDFTYIDDIVNGIYKVMLKPATKNLNWDGNKPDPATSKSAFKLYNIGNNKPVELCYAISVLENALGKKAVQHLQDIQPGDVAQTSAHIDDIIRDAGFEPSITIEEGIPKFVDWYRAWRDEPDQLIERECLKAKAFDK
ncbi:MAG: NAD-dependent epimerase/dehydratase family protein, partial [Pseudomonadota bacterium]